MAIDHVLSQWSAAAEAGDADAQFGLGFSLAATEAPQDYAQAIEWYQRAAEQNHRLAQFNLAQMFAHGQGVPKDESAALMWMRRAADGGDAGAQFQMGDLCVRSSMRGKQIDLSESRIEAYKWLTLAAAQNYRDAQGRSDSASLQMSRDEVTEGLRRVRDFATGLTGAGSERLTPAPHPGADQ